MIEIAPGLALLRGTPDYMVNVYLAGDVLIDAGTRMATAGILRQLRGRTLTAHALTHVHPDHQGASKAVCETFGVPLWCPAGDVESMETGSMGAGIPQNAITSLIQRIWSGPPYPVARPLREGDVVAGFTVLDTPGHSPGHIAYWRESDRLLIAGDTARNISFVTLQAGLGEPPTAFTVDPVENRRSLRKLAALAPQTVVFGHGQPLRDGARFVEFVDRLPTP